MWLFYFLFWTAVRAREEPLYGKIGDKTLLTPDSVVKPIYTIAWKHGPSNAIEWFSYEDETISHQQFKDRGSLNTSTGALTITGLTPDDSGNYTVEINNKVTSKTQLLVISPVSKPTLSLWCEPEMTYCVLTCNGDTTGAEPVTYWWTSGDITWSSTKEHNITKENQEPWFKCTFKNPVSLNSSEKVFNPFIMDLTWIYILIAVFGVILVGGIIISIYLMYKGRKREAAVRNWQEFLKKWDKEYQELLDEVVNSKISEINKTSTQDLETAESPDTSNETGEAAERKLQEMLKRLREEFLERLAEGDADERRRQEYLQWKKKEFLKRLAEGDADERNWQERLERWDKGDYDHAIWQDYLKKKRKGAAERARQEFLERYYKEMSVLLPPVENLCTQDPVVVFVVTQDPSNETEESPMIPDNAETRC